MANKEQALVGVLIYPGSRVPTQYTNMIRSRWIRSYRTGNGFMKIVHPPAYYFNYQNYVEIILNRKNTEVHIAALESDDDVVLGFSVVEGKILHYVHVPRAYRRQHIATMLVPEDIEWITHLTDMALQIWSTKLPDARFNPFG